MAEGIPDITPLPCRYCEGEGWYEDVSDYTAPFLRCHFCKATGKRPPAGPALPDPSEAWA